MEGKVYMEDLIVEKYIPNGHEYRKHRETVDGHVACPEVLRCTKAEMQNECCRRWIKSCSTKQRRS